jgi:hypothetical protein
MLAAAAKKRKLDQVKAKAVKGKVRTPSDRSYCCHFPLHLITDTSSDLHPISNDCKPLCDISNKAKKKVASTTSSRDTSQQPKLFQKLTFDCLMEGIVHLANCIIKWKESSEKISQVLCKG